MALTSTKLCRSVHSNANHLEELVHFILQGLVMGVYGSNSFGGSATARPSGSGQDWLDDFFLQHQQPGYRLQTFWHTLVAARLCHLRTICLPRSFFRS